MKKKEPFVEYPYIEKASPKELLEFLPHKLIQRHPEAIGRNFSDKAK